MEGADRGGKRAEQGRKAKSKQSGRSTEEPREQQEQLQDQIPLTVKELHISYNWWVLVVHIWILYYLLSSLTVLSDLTVRTFAHYVWVLVAATMLLFVAARWFPDLEIALIRHVVVPLQGLLWVLFWTALLGTSPNDLYAQGGDVFIPFTKLGTFTSIVYPLIFLNLFTFLRRNLFCIVIRDFDITMSTASHYMWHISNSLTTLAFVIAWDWLVRPEYPCQGCIDMFQPPSTFLILFIATVHNFLFSMLLLAGGIGLVMPVYWETLLQNGMGVWVLPDSQPMVYVFS